MNKFKLEKFFMGIYKKYFKKYIPLFILGISFVFLEAVCDLLQPTVWSRIVDDGIRSGSVPLTIRYGLTMLGVTAAGAVFACVRNILASRVSQSFGADLRQGVFEKIMRFSQKSCDKLGSGSIITRMTNDTNQITMFLNGLMRIFFKAPVMCIGSIILAVTLSMKLSFILLGAIAIVTVCIFISMKLSYSRFYKVQIALDHINTVLQEYLMGIRLVKAFGRFRNETDKFEDANGDLSEKMLSSQIVIAVFSPIMSMTVSLGIALIIYAGGKMFGAGAVEVGKVAAFITYMNQILHSLIMITNIFNTFVRTKASTRRIQEIMGSEEEAGGGAAVLQDAKGAVKFENVTFAYPEGSGVAAIKNLSFEVPAGQTLAVIGPTGSGKSTLCWLLLRFYPVTNGKITIDGVDIQSLECKNLREVVSLAPQRSALFTGSISRNIKWGRQNADEKEVAAAGELALASGFISGMPDKYESPLGQEGVNLSGGQKQRISIARALLKNSPVTIFDDCMSALDAVTEESLRKNLAHIHGKTKIIITQRIGTAMGADKILVLDNGERVGFGSHEELIGSCDIYKDIYLSQIGGQDG